MPEFRQKGEVYPWGHRSRDAIMKMGSSGHEPDLMLIGYSKGAPDILDALVSYSEIRPRIAAIVSTAGAVGGSPLSSTASQSELEMMRYWPDADCSVGDGGALESLRRDKRKAWLDHNPLPQDIPYFSLVTYPTLERRSSVLEFSDRKLKRIDPRNDGQLLYYHQVIPGSSLMGYVNADHWTIAVPASRSHSTMGFVFVDQNQYPREALTEALLRFVEEKIAPPHQ